MDTQNVTLAMTDEIPDEGNFTQTICLVATSDFQSSHNSLINNKGARKNGPNLLSEFPEPRRVAKTPTAKDDEARKKYNELFTF